MKKRVSEPLLHFLVLGLGLFCVHGMLNRGTSEADSQTILVSRDNLLRYLQYRARIFDTASFSDMLSAMPEQELQRVIRDYVREEALYREAKALHLDGGDYLARARLIQQFEFVMRGFAEGSAQPSEQEIQRYYEAHKERYRVAPKATFTHVFFSSQLHGEAHAETLARDELRRLNEDAVSFDRAPSHGERFLYQLNYVEQRPDEIADHFGASMQKQLFALKPDERLWRGPFRSPYGFHLVLLVRNEAGYLPPLAQIRSAVEQDARQALLDARLEESIESLVKSYKVKIEPLKIAGSPQTKVAS